jgi:structural maintenance of chromosome 4
MSEAEIQRMPTDKTDEFTTQIEQKQLELEPWTAKVSEKQSAIDVAVSEKSVLEARATAGQQAWTDAVARLEALTEGLSAKVSHCSCKVRHGIADFARFSSGKSTRV